jgi:hypothetical protein
MPSSSLGETTEHLAVALTGAAATRAATRELYGAMPIRYPAPEEPATLTLSVSDTVQLKCMPCDHARLPDDHATCDDHVATGYNASVTRYNAVMKRL